MAKAKNKAVDAQEIIFQDRMKRFEVDLIELIKKYQVGIRPYIGKYAPQLEYIDLVELQKNQNEQKAEQN